MNYEEALEIITYFNNTVKGRLPKAIFKTITIVPLDVDDQVSFRDNYARRGYPQSMVEEIKDKDLTIGVYYYDNSPIESFCLLNEKWLNHYGINNFSTKYLKMLQS